MASPEKLAYRTEGPICWKFDAALARVTLVPPAPKSHRAMTPFVGNPGLARSAASAAVASETKTGGAPARAKSVWAKNSSRSAPDWASDQYAGIEMITGDPYPTVRAIASIASIVSAAPRYFVPSAATNGARSPTRSTNPRSTSPDSVRFGFSSGRPTSVGRCSNSVNTELRVTGAPPARAATMLASPIDSPSDSLISHNPRLVGQTGRQRNRVRHPGNGDHRR